MRIDSKTTALVAGIVAALVGGLLVYRLLTSAPSLPELAAGTLIEPPRPLPTVKLIDQDNRAFDNSRFQGRWSLVFFGFANCGDICPVTLALLAATRKTLQDLPASDLPQIVFVSVDPQRDTAEVLKKYVATFGADVVGVTGPQSDVDAFTKALGVPSGIRALENGGYAVDHSGSVLAVNPRGEWRALFSPPHTVEGLSADYRRLAGGR